MNKSILKTVFFSMTLLGVSGTTDLLCMEPVNIDKQHQQLMADAEAMVLAKISKEELAQIQAIEVEIAQAAIETDTQELVAKRDAMRAQILSKFDEEELAKIHAKGAEICTMFDAEIAEIAAGLRKLDKELLYYKHAREKFLDECVDEFSRNPFSIENLVKNGDADVLESLFQNGLENKINQRWYLVRPRMSKFLELAKQHNQVNVVAVLKPYADKERKERDERFYLNLIPSVCGFTLASLWFLLGGHHTFGG